MSKPERALLIAVARALAAVVENPAVSIPETEYVALLNALERFQPTPLRKRVPRDIRDQHWRRDVAILGGDPSL